MSVRKRTWTTRDKYEDGKLIKPGEKREAWIVDYVDQKGERHIENFERKKDADAHHATVKVDVGKGVHTARNKSVTVAKAAADWIAYVEAEGRERSTVEQYDDHVRLHITPALGSVKLAD